MKLRAIIFTLIVVLIASTVCAYNSQKWTVMEGESEMGEQVTAAAVRDSDPDANALLAVANTEGSLLVLLQLYNIQPSYSEYSVEFKVDSNDIITLRARQLSNPQGFGIKLNNRLLDQLMRGYKVKVRFDSMSKGLVVIDFTLNNSMPAISRIIGGET